MAVSYRGAISFGLVHIPVGLYMATQDNDIHFNQLCREDGSRIKYKKVCASCGKEVSSKDIVKGFEYDKDKFVIMSKVRPPVSFLVVFRMISSTNCDTSSGGERAHHPNGIPHGGGL